mgnify:CR=1 FL=1
MECGGTFVGDVTDFGEEHPVLPGDLDVSEFGELLSFGTGVEESELLWRCLIDLRFEGFQFV